MKKILLISTAVILSILLLASCTTTLYELATGKTDTTSKKESAKKKSFNWADAEEDLGEELYSSLREYNIDFRTRISVSSSFNFPKSNSGYGYSGDAVMSIYLDAADTSAGSPDLSIEYKYSVYSSDYYSATNSTFTHYGIDDTPAYILLCSDYVKDSAYVNLYWKERADYTGVIGGSDAERFIMNCPSSAVIRIEVYNANGNRINAVFYRGDSRSSSSEYYHTFKAGELQTLIKAYNILRAYGKDKAVSTTLDTGFTVIKDYVTPLVWMNSSPTSVVLSGDSFYLRYMTYVEGKRYGLNDNPGYLLLRVPGEEESLEIAVDGSGSYKMTNDIIRFIMQYSEDAKIEVSYYNKNRNRIMLYYRNYDGERTNEYKTDYFRVGSMKKLLDMYYSLYGKETVEGFDDLSYMGLGSGCVYSSFSNPVVYDDGKLVLRYHTYSENGIAGLRDTPSYLLLTRSDGKRMMIGVDNTGALRLGNDALKFLYESPEGSEIELTYYYKNKNQIYWYYYDENYSRKSVLHKDIIDADGARRLISMYSLLLDDPLDSWEFNMEGALDYILGLDEE